MAHELFLIRRGEAFYPYDGLAQEETRQIPAGKPLRHKVTVPRSVPQNRLYWKALGLVCENLDGGVRKEALHKWLLGRLGYVDVIPLRNGKVDQVPASTAFDSMPQAEFNAYSDKAFDLICEEIIPGLNKADLLEQAEFLLGRAA